MTRATTDLYRLGVDECVRLLDSDEAGGVGRVVVSLDALPAAFPVNYRLIGHEIVFKTSPGTKLSAAVSHAVIGFEVDHIEPRQRRGWSVLVVGLSRVIDDPVELARVQAAGIDSWGATGADVRYVSIELQRVTGRRLEAGGAA